MGNEDTEGQAKKQHDPLAHLVLDPTVFTVTGTDSWTRLDGKYTLAKQGGAETLEFETYWPRVYTRLNDDGCRIVGKISLKHGLPEARWEILNTKCGELGVLPVQMNHMSKRKVSKKAAFPDQVVWHGQKITVTRN